MQASAYFLPEAHGRFVAYASRVGLEPSQLLQLLMLGELARRQLYRDWSAGRLTELPRQPRGKAMERIKVTARITDSADSKALREYIGRLGLGPTKVATLIAQRELKKPWLEPLVRGKRQRSV